MYIKRLWFLNGILNCHKSFAIKLGEKSQVAWGCRRSSKPERHSSTWYKHIYFTVKCQINGTVLQTKLYRRTNCYKLQVINPPIDQSARSYSCNQVLLPHIDSRVKVKDGLTSHCNCFYSVSTTTDGGDTDSYFVKLAKEIIKDAKMKDVMAGSVPIIKVVKLLKDLDGQKFHLDQVMHVLSQQLNLLQQSEIVSPLTELLLLHGLKHSVVIRVLEKLPFYDGSISLQNLHKFIDDSIKNLRLLGFTEKNLHSILTSYPEILLTDSKNHSSILSRLKGLFTTEDAFNVIISSPNVLSVPWTETNMKFDYAYFTMGYKQKEILKSHLFEHNLEHIQDRHLFLARAGFFLPVKEKDDPQLNPNPPLHEVIDAPDIVFARMFGGLSLEEYRAYLEMREIEREEENNVSDAMDETDDEEKDDDTEEKQYLHKNTRKDKLKWK